MRWCQTCGWRSRRCRLCWRYERTSVYRQSTKAYCEKMTSFAVALSRARAPTFSMLPVSCIFLFEIAFEPLIRAGGVGCVRLCKIKQAFVLVACDALSSIASSPVIGAIKSGSETLLTIADQLTSMLMVYCFVLWFCFVFQQIFDFFVCFVVCR
jgi:hypothetical protein